MGKRLALLIGISEYGKGFTPLSGSLNDVRAIQEVLADQECGSFDVKVLENYAHDTLRHEIEVFFRNKATDDTLLLYFSGHGDLGSGGLIHQTLHLCTHNSYKEDGRLIESSALSVDFVIRQLNLSKSQKIVVILDCCNSGAIVKKGEQDIDVNFSSLTAKGWVFLMSSNSVQPSHQELDGLSLYTRYLLEGMRGAAYLGQGDWIMAQDLHSYAERKFSQLNISLPKIATVETGFNLPIVKAPKPNPELEYRKECDLILQKLEQFDRLNFDGEIVKPLERRRLEVLRQKLNLSIEDAQGIELEVKIPYQNLARKRQEYKKAFELVIQEGFLPSEYDRQTLEKICLDLELRKADADFIEKALTQERKLKAKSTPYVQKSQVKPKPRRTSFPWVWLLGMLTGYVIIGFLLHSFSAPLISWAAAFTIVLIVSVCWSWVWTVNWEELGNLFTVNVLPLVLCIIGAIALGLFTGPWGVGIIGLMIVYVMVISGAALAATIMSITTWALTGAGAGEIARGKLLRIFDQWQVFLITFGVSNVGLGLGWLLRLVFQSV